MNKFIIVKNPHEYLCLHCGQLRLSLTGEKSTIKCKNCGSTNIIIGEVNSLNKDILKEQSNE